MRTRARLGLLATALGATALGATVACSSFSADEGAPQDGGPNADGASDAPLDAALDAADAADAATSFCANLLGDPSTRPLFCADFEQPDLTVFVNGNAGNRPLPASDPAVKVDLSAAGRDSAHALHILSTGGTFVLTGVFPSFGAGTQRTRVEAEFDLDVRSAPLANPIAGGPKDPRLTLSIVRFDNPAFNPCFAAFQYDQSIKGGPILQSHCGAKDHTNFTQALMATPTPGWRHYRHVVDLSTSRATVDLGGVTLAPLDLLFPVGEVVGGGAPSAEFGVPEPNVTVELVLDNIVVRAQ